MDDGLTRVGLLPHHAVNVDGREERDARRQVRHAEPGAEQRDRFRD